MRILILDDMDVRHSGFAKVFADLDRTHVYFFSDTIDALNTKGPFDVVYLDHDLGDFRVAEKNEYDRPYTGHDVALYIARVLDPDKRPGRVVVHSWNPDGARAMRQVLQDAGIPAVCLPYSDPDDTQIRFD